MYAEKNTSNTKGVLTAVFRGKGDIMILMSDPAFQGYSFKEQVDTDKSSVMVIKNETSEGSMRCLETFSGITLSYNSLRMKSCYQQVAPMEGFISLNYCREG